MSGEILRNVLTSGTRMRRQRFYQAPTIVIPANSAVGLTRTATINFERGREFLCTGMQFEAYNAGTGSAGIFNCGLEVMLSKPSNGHAFFRDFTHPYGMFPGTFNQNMDNVTGQYIWFQDNENLTISVRVATSKVSTFNCQFAVTGIEYIQ